MIWKIISSFLLMLLLLVGLGFVAINEMMKLSNITQKLYDHPFTVTNATKNIQSNLISMHRHMKDVVLSTNATELENAILLVDEDEVEIYIEFATVFKNYLGSRDDIYESYNAFVAWKPIRDEVIELERSNKLPEAVFITKNKGYEHVKELNRKVDKLVIYAQNKADHFLMSAIEKRNSAILTLVLIVIVMLGIIGVTLVLLIKNIKKIESEKEETLERLKEAQNIAKLGTWTLEFEDSSYSWNDETYNIFGLKVGTEVSLDKFYSFVHEEDLEMLQSAYKEHLKTKSACTIVYRIINTKGVVKFIEQRCKTSFSNNKPIISYGVLQDVSEAMKEKIDLNNKLTRDELTGTFNRAFFNQNIDNFLTTIEDGKKLGIVMLDIDHFKKVNDTYGHDVGDSVLKEMCETVNNSIRNDDYLVRWGGEEFVLIIKIANIENLYHMIDKIRIAIQKYEFTTVGKVTCSFGITLHKDEEDIKQTLIRADEALYLAKESGRNQVQSA